MIDYPLNKGFKANGTDLDSKRLFALEKDWLDYYALGA